MTITNLVPGTKYAFVVMAETYCGYGGNSSIAQGSTKVDGKLLLCERFFVQLWYPLKLPTKGNCVCVESWRQRNPPVITLNEKISQKQNKHTERKIRIIFCRGKHNKNIYILLALLIERMRGEGVIPLNKYSIIGGASTVTKYTQPPKEIKRKRKHRWAGTIAHNYSQNLSRQKIECFHSRG